MNDVLEAALGLPPNPDAEVAIGRSALRWRALHAGGVGIVLVALIGGMVLLDVLDRMPYGLLPGPAVLPLGLGLGLVLAVLSSAGLLGGVYLWRVHRAREAWDEVRGALRAVTAPREVPAHALRAGRGSIGQRLTWGLSLVSVGGLAWTLVSSRVFRWLGDPLQRWLGGFGLSVLEFLSGQVATAIFLLWVVAFWAIPAASHRQVRQAARRPPAEALEELEELLGAHWARGRAHLALGSPQEAAAELLDLGEANAPFLGALRRALPVAAETLLALDRPDAARRAAGAAVRHGPAEPAAWAARVRVDLATGAVDEETVRRITFAQRRHTARLWGHRLPLQELDDLEERVRRALEGAGGRAP